MKNTTANRFLLTLILFPNLLLSTGKSFAQHYEIRTYKIQVLMDSGEKLKGMLSGVSESTLYVEDKRRDIIKIPLTTIRKVKLIDVNNIRSRTIIGAILGGLAIGYVAYLGNSRSPGGSRSPVLGGISIALGTGAGAALVRSWANSQRV